MNSHFQPNNPRKRHQLLHEEAPANHIGRIKDIKSLRAHLQTAIEIEHATIPAYLTALYTIDVATNSFAYQAIQGVVMEEMLHMIQSANILNAIGGHPDIDKMDFIPNYPTSLPHSNKSFTISLQKFSKDTLDVFLHIEMPAAHGALPEGDHYTTIGQFYNAIKHALRHLNQVTPGGIFTGESARQVTSQHYYGSGGKLIPVFSLTDALLGINEIMGQGEGIDGSIFDPDHTLFGDEIEYAHYFKFNEVRCEQRYLITDSVQCPPSGEKVEVNWQAALNMQANPKMSDYPIDSPIYNKTYQFNRTYMTLLTGIHDACNGQPELLMKSIPLMYDLKYKALDLMNTPIGNGQMAGPSFEYVKIDRSQTDR